MTWQTSVYLDNLNLIPDERMPWRNHVVSYTRSGMSMFCAVYPFDLDLAWVLFRVVLGKGRSTPCQWTRAIIGQWRSHKFALGWGYITHSSSWFCSSNAGLFLDSSHLELLTGLQGWSVASVDRPGMASPLQEGQTNWLINNAYLPSLEKWLLYYDCSVVGS